MHYVICQHIFTLIMKKSGLNLNFSEIRKRIELEKKPYKPGDWAKLVGVSPNVISNIHGSTQQRPSLEYIIAVSIATNKSVDYYLWGKTPEEKKPTYQFKNLKTGLKNIEYLIWIEHESEALYKEVTQHLKTTQSTAKILKKERKKIS